MQAYGVVAIHVAGFHADVPEFLAAQGVLHAEVAYCQVCLAVRYRGGDSRRYQALAAAIQAHGLQVGVAYAAAEACALRGYVAPALKRSVECRIAAQHAAAPGIAIVVGHRLHAGIVITKEAQAVHQQRIEGDGQPAALRRELEARLGRALADLRHAEEFAYIEIAGVHSALNLQGSVLAAQTLYRSAEGCAPHAGTELAARL